MGNIGYDKDGWIRKLFRYKEQPSKIYTKHNTADIKIIGALYFESKMWYYVKYTTISYDPIVTQRTKYLLVYFGHHQPLAKSLYEYNTRDYKCAKFEEIIEFTDSSQLPSTIVPIDQLVEIVHDATINTKATNLAVDTKDQNILLTTKLFMENFRSLVKYNGEPITTTDGAIQHNLYGMLNSYRFFMKMVYDFGIHKFNFYRSTIGPVSKNHNKNYGYGRFIGYQPSELYRKFYKDNNNSKSMRVPYHIADSDLSNYKVLIIGHGVRIGALLNKKLFKYRSLSFVMCGNTMVTNMHHNSLELDNHWNYTNNYSVGTKNEDAVDEGFISPEITDQNINDLKYHNINNNNEINIDIDKSLSDIIARDNDILKNKLIDKKHLCAHSLLTMLSDELIELINKEEVLSNE